jgi:hypothetical protein
MFIIEHDEIKDEMRIVVTFGELGHRCGYVGIKKEHPLFGRDYGDTLPVELKHKADKLKESPLGKRGIFDLLCFDPDEVKIGFLFDVHGSITYSGGNNYPVPNELREWWFFGFDCAHYGDAKDLDCADKYGFKLYYYPYFSEGEVRTLDYVLEECYNLAQQLGGLNE